MLLFACVLAQAAQSTCFDMFSRASQPAASTNASPGDVFEDDVADLYAETLISAQRAAKLLDKATKAGIKGISKKVRKTTGKIKPDPSQIIG